jgi:ERCC4-type nuclease
MRIIIDEREQSLYDKIDSIVNLEGNNTSIQICKKVLPLGDIIIQTDNGHDVALIERKTLYDLLASIKDGRYEEQSYRLVHSGEHQPHNIIYMIEGMFSQLKTPLEKRIILSSITSLQFFKGFSVLRTCSLNETAETIVWMAEKIEKEFQKGKLPAYILSKNTGNDVTTVNDTEAEYINNTQLSSSNYCNVVKKVKKENITPENIGEIILCQIPGISSVTAIAIMKKYGNISMLMDVIRTSPDSMENIVYESNGKTRKISKTSIKNIRNYLYASHV